MNKVWLVLFDDKDRWEQTCIFSTREKANEFAINIGKEDELIPFSKVSRETDPFDIYEYEDDDNDIFSIIIEEFEVK